MHHDPPNLSAFRQTPHAKKVLRKVDLKGAAGHSTLGQAATANYFGNENAGAPPVLATA